ncbi:hypothetical protein DZC30_01430 [Comamonas testosteroni]|uniref:Uncharacterized protein n=1 Tax=Comamonas testosteroni TaxID=285 RepID=A0A373FSE6_COMTE|nr:hypothetical protein DZC30_01430 [Comamonas testosteroni]
MNLLLNSLYGAAQRLGAQAAGRGKDEWQVKILAREMLFKKQVLNGKIHRSEKSRRFGAFAESSGSIKFIATSL